MVELYGSTETMLLGTGCAAGNLHLEPDLAHCEILGVDGNEAAGVNQEGRLVVTTISIEGSPLVRFDTGDRVRRLPPCTCGDPRQAIIVLGRENDVVELAGRRFHSYEIIDAAAAAADRLDSSVFFAIVLPDRLLVRIEAEGRSPEARAELSGRLGDLPVEIELTDPNELLDIETLSRSPSVYKPVLVSDWMGPGRRILSVSQGMIEWPSLSLPELRRWLMRMLRARSRRRRLARQIRVAKGSRP